MNKIVTTEAIVIRQVKTLNETKMVRLFTKAYGKIDLGIKTWKGRGKNSQALSLKPFAYGTYQLQVYKNSFSYYSGEIEDSNYHLGEDINKYMCASFALELTDKVIEMESPQPRVFNLLRDYLKISKEAKTDSLTSLLAYEIKLLDLLGIAPNLDDPLGENSEKVYFSIPDGSLIDERTREEIFSEKLYGGQEETLIFKPKFDMIEIMKFFQKKQIYVFGKVALEPKTSEELQKIIRGYYKYHLHVEKLKSEEWFSY